MHWLKSDFNSPNVNFYLFSLCRPMWKEWVWGLGLGFGRNGGNNRLASGIRTVEYLVSRV